MSGGRRVVTVKAWVSLTDEGVPRVYCGPDGATVYRTFRTRADAERNCSNGRWPDLTRATITYSVGKRPARPGKKGGGRG